MSAQPARDAGQLQKNKMKLALAVGDNRRYVVDEIVPRHFMQTAARSGTAAAAVKEICAKLSHSADAAIDNTLAALPADFPKALTHSVTSGLRARLRTMPG
jgi:serine/threonine-protein kinase HipA